MFPSSDVAGGSAFEDTYHQDLDQTVAALEGGYDTLAPRTAISVITTWYDTLKNSDRSDLHVIAQLLGELRDALGRDTLDGPAIGDLLLRLGDQTTAAAATASDARLTPRLEHLGTILTRAGNALTSSASS